MVDKTNLFMRFTRHMHCESWVFCGFSLMHFMLWSLAPSFGFRSPPLDVIENLFWGQVWPLGTYKHPPLQAWLTEIAWQIGGVTGVYVLAQLCVIATASAIFLLGSALTRARIGLCAAGIYYLSFYATISSPEFNANLLSAPFWAFAGYFLWRLIETPEAAYKTRYWVGLVLMMVGAFYTKYAVLFLLIGLLLAAMCLPTGRKLFQRPKFYISVLSGILLCVPNLIWLFQHDFLPLGYAVQRADNLQGWDRLLNPISFLVGIAVSFVVPLLLLLLAGARWQKPKILKSQLYFLLSLSFTPMLAMCLLAIIGGSGLKTMWGASAAVWLPLFYMQFIQLPNGFVFRQKSVLWGAFSLAILLPLVVAGYSRYSEATDRPQRSAWDGQNLADFALEGWASHYANAPAEKGFSERPRIILGPTWEAGLVAHFAPYRPLVFVEGDFVKNPWITSEMLHYEGALIVWSGHEQSYKRFAPFEAQGSIQILHKGRQIPFHWAILAPKPVEILP